MTSSYPELYTKNVRVWIKHPTEVWQCATVQRDFDKNGAKLYVTNEEAEEIILEVKDNAALPPLRNPDILIGANDLTSLSYLHEPSVLYNLRVRFLQHNSIYTWCGIVLVAVNPFAELEIYGEATIQTYHANYALSQLDPHIYAVAEDAFTKLERNEANQSVIVSGESGAGKTVSAKFAMRYFASIAGSDGSNIEDRVLASNPIMEAIGNAKTVRNDNSSRFGKYIQILFDRRVTGGPASAIMGGNMRTYLLEKSRVTYQSEGERNFHVFYQLVNWAQKEGLDYLGLNDESTFAYLGSNEPTAYDDMSKFIEAANTLGFTERQKAVIFAVVAAILHGGNVDFESLDDESCRIGADAEAGPLARFIALLGVSGPSLKRWLTHEAIKSGGAFGGGEVIVKPLNAAKAAYSLEAMLKYMYERLFLWIVGLINVSLGPPGALSEYQFIGVLDIYGFEHFETNSFEQFCINYANEVLQQQFNLHVFKLEQEEYVREGIDWTFITFNDNQTVIDLIETRPLGILSLLDEECKVPRGNDDNWCTKLYGSLSAKYGEVFRKPKFGWQRSFIIQHFADVVTYSVGGFVEKNRDKMEDEVVELLKSSEVIGCLFAEDLGLSGTGGAGAPGAKGGADGGKGKGAGGKVKITHQDQRSSAAAAAAAAKKAQKATVGWQFKESLEALMKILNSTEPHYVRCIKPNDVKGAFTFNNERAVQQLRACGVLETIRISSNGFPSRWSYQDFANRYRVLRVGYAEELARMRAAEVAAENEARGIGGGGGGPPKPTPRKLVKASSGSSTAEIRQICEDIVKIVYEEKVYSHFKLAKDESPKKEKDAETGGIESELRRTRQLYQFGKTKIFFRPGQVALLERIRSQKLRECAVLMQRMIRGWLVRKRFLRIKAAILALQTYSRGYLARRHYLWMRQTRAATVVQTAWRRYHQRKVYLQICRSVLALQTAGRAYLARQRYLAVRQRLAAITIQRYWRGYAARKEYAQTRAKIVLVQSCIRRFLARRALKRLRIEARSVEHVTNLNKGLEKKIIELQQRLDELNESGRAAQRATLGQVDALRAEAEAAVAEVAKYKAREVEAERLKEEARRTAEELTKELQQLAAKVKALEKANGELQARLAESATAKAAEAAVDVKALEEALAAREQELRAEFERERRQLAGELKREQAAKQQLLSRFIDLESETSEREASSAAASALREAAAAAIASSSAVLDQAAPPTVTSSSSEAAPAPTAAIPSAVPSTPKLPLMTIATSHPLAPSPPTAKGSGHQQLQHHQQPHQPQDFETNLAQIQVMMRCTELEQELEKMKADNQKLRRTMARTIDQGAKEAKLQQQQQNSTGGTSAGTPAAAAATSTPEGRAGAAALLAEQFAEVQEELERYKKERADLKKVILIEDWITTAAAKPGSTVEEKYQTDLLSAYKSLYTQLDEEIAKKEKLIQKLKNENIYLRMNSGNKLIPGGAGGPNSLMIAGGGVGPLSSLDPASLETMDIDPSVCYLGMFKLKQSDIDFIVRFLIYDVGPQNTFKCDAQTVSYITYMCIRYIDHINNEEMIQRFMAELISMTRKKAQMAIQRNALESIVHVLSIAYKIAIMLKYYSEYDIDRHQNNSTEKSKSNGGGGGDQNGENKEQSEEDYDFSQALKNFDLTDYTKVLRDLIIWIYLKLIKLFQTRINNLIVPALLEHEELASSGMNVQKSIHRSGSISSERESPSPTEKEIHTLIKELSNIETMFRMHKLDEDFVFQFFKQIYYFIGTVCLNNLLMRKDLCNNNKAIQIIYNLSYFEQFLREHAIPNWEEVKSMLDAITQANKLLITNKTDRQVPAIIQTTQALSVPQIVKIINMYTASDEETVPKDFIKNLTLALQKDRHTSADDKSSKVLIMQAQSYFPLKIPYIDDEDEEAAGSAATSTAASAAVVSGLKVNLKEIELPLLLKALDRYLEKI